MIRAAALTMGGGFVLNWADTHVERAAMKLFLTCLYIIAAGLIGMMLGGFLGFWGLFAFAQAYVAGGGAPANVQALPYMTMVTAPAGALLGAIIGIILAFWARKRYRARRAVQAPDVSARPQP